MSVPVPPVPLENVCSVIHDNVLYVYSPTAFLKLELTPGAEWEELPNGVSVTNGVCVGSTPKDDGLAGFYVVGGLTDDDGYNGMQRFTYATGKWESISPASAVTKHRRWHAATYLAGSDSILIYAGNQDGIVSASSQTFTIRAHAPFEVTSFQSIAPAGVSPILLQWSETDAILVGGDVNNRKVMLFNPETSWKDSGASLADPIPKDSTSVKGVLLDGDDGSRSLYTFDMTEMPTIVRRMVLLDAKGAPVTDSPTVLARGLSLRQSDSSDSPLTLGNWPRYNDTLAPTETRSQYGVATDGKGLVVFAGGIKEKDSHALCLFDARGNSWVDPSIKFSAQQVLSDDRDGGVDSTRSSTTARSLAGATSTSTSTGTGVAAAAGSGSVEMSSNAILGIVLGSIFGLMVILGLLLFLIRRKKARRNHLEAGHLRRDSGPPAVEKNGFAADMVGSPRGHFRGHQQQDSAGSYSSMAILMGRMNQQKQGLRRKPSNDTTRSSTSSIFNREFKASISKPIPQMGKHPALRPNSPAAGERTPTAFGASLPPRIPPPRPPRGNATLDRSGSTRRSSGWNRYWSGGSGLNMLGFGAKRQTMESDLTSRYSANNRITQDSATVPPLQLHLDGKPELNRVNSGSPTVAQYSNKIPMREGLMGKIERPISSTTSSGYSSGIPDSVHEAWDPLAAKKPWGADRAPSSAYGSSSSTQGLSKNTSLDPSSTSPRAVAPGVSKQPQLAMASTSSDMSWLNLGDFNRRS